MEPKTLIVLGSPRKKGNSATLAAQVAKGVLDSGGVAETIYLNSMNITQCQGCRKCREYNAGCIIKDDMQLLYAKLKEAHAIVLASPVYFFNISSQLKTFIDRCYSVGIGSNNIFKGKKFSLILTYGDSDPFLSGAVNAIRSFQDTCNYIGGEVSGLIYGQANKVGEIANNKHIMDKAYALGRKMFLSESGK